MKYEINSDSVETTHALASKIAKQLSGGEVIELIGDVGSGKTTFVIGLGKALGCKEDVSSPTFTICNTYRGRLTVQHCDFYRLNNDDFLISQELEDLMDGENVVVLEWSENLAKKVEDSIKIYFEHLANEGRKIIVESKKELTL